MRALVRLIGLVVLSGPAVVPASAAFSSLYVFGDGVCSTTDNPGGGSLYYQSTYSNGRIWIQVLAQRQGIAYNASKNQSYFGHYSSSLVTHVNAFSAADATNSLFVVWVNDADFVWDMQNLYPSLNPSTWNSAISSSLASHSQAVATLYSKGARTLIMPNAVDITKIPQYSGLSSSEKNFIRQKVVEFNSGFSTVANQAMASMSGLKIYVPDFFAQLDSMLAQPAAYGLVNPGYSALDDPNLEDYSLNGPGASYVFWDPFDPSAKAHAVMADVAQRSVSPATVTAVTAFTGSNRLDVVNIPIGLNGFVDGRTNLVTGSWLQLTNFSSISATQSVFVRSTAPRQFYRLRFPFAWSWP